MVNLGLLFGGVWEGEADVLLFLQELVSVGLIEWAVLVGVP